MKRGKSGKSMSTHMHVKIALLVAIVALTIGSATSPNWVEEKSDRKDRTEVGLWNVPKQMSDKPETVALQVLSVSAPIIAAVSMALALLHKKMHYTTSIVSILLLTVLGVSVGLASSIAPKWISAAPLFVESRMGYCFYMQIASLVLSVAVIALSLMRGK